MLCRTSWKLALVMMGLLAGVPVWAEPPEISDPLNRAPVGSMPGTYPTTVTATNINVEQFLPATYNGTNKDHLRVSFPSSGPVKWTGSRFNQGDLSLNIGPFNPNDASYFPPTAFTDNYKPLDGQPFANTTLGWRLNSETGIALASVRTNGYDHGPTYTFGGSPVGRLHGIAYFNDKGTGWGYRMDNGVLANGNLSPIDTGSLDLQMGIAGFDNNLGEASFNTAAAFFPYEQGWKGAWVNGGTNGAATFSAGAPGLNASAVTWTAGRATVTLPGVNSATDGMLFVAPTHNNDLTNIAAAFPTDGGWKVALREDDAVAPAVTLGATENGFSFLYVPYTTGGLIGGEINGGTGAAINAAGQTRFSLARTDAGKYSLSVFAADGVTKKTGDEGMLIMSVSSALASNPTIADKAFLSYEYDAGTQNFLIESRADVAINSPNSENQFGDDVALRDANFYFAWVDFANPFTPPVTSLPGDFDGNGVVNGLDLDDWKDSFGVDNGADAEGDGDSDGADFLVWQQNLGAGAAAPAAGAVPEPASLATIAFAALSLAASRRRI